MAVFFMLGCGPKSILTHFDILYNYNTFAYAPRNDRISLFNEKKTFYYCFFFLMRLNPFRYNTSHTALFECESFKIVSPSECITNRIKSSVFPMQRQKKKRIAKQFETHIVKHNVLEIKPTTSVHFQSFADWEILKSTKKKKIK